MATNSSPEAAGGQPLAVTTLFAALSPEFREAVVLRALRFRGQTTGDAGRALDSAIRGNLRIPDYRHPDSAPPHILAEPVAKAMFHSERLAGAALRVWAESHRELQQVVSEHLAAAAIPAEYLDLPENGFRSVWDAEAWEQQLDWIADVATDWAEDDLALMLCYVSGKTIIAADEDYPDAAVPADVADYREDAGQPAAAAPAAVVEPEAPPVVEPESPPEREAAAEAEPAAEIETVAELEPAAEIPVAALPASRDHSGDLTGADLLARCVAWLELLPAAAPEWEAAVPAFVSAVNKLQEDNQSHKERFAGLRQTLTEIAAEFAPELDFLEQDAAAWSADRLTDLPAVNRMLETAAELKSLLTEYRQVHHPAASISEERRRRERLADLERQLLQNLGRMSRQMAGDRGNADQPADAPAAAADAELGDPAEIPPSLDEIDTADPDDPDFQGELIYEPVEEDALPAEPPAAAAREAATTTPRSTRARTRRNNSRANRNG